jgi:hypothetical protein
VNGAQDDMTVCARCGRTLPPGRVFRFATSGGASRRLCIWCALRHLPVVQRALVTALVVGTILTVINQGDALVTLTLTPVLLWKIPLTYFVPYAVSTYSAVAISRERA